MSDLWLKTKKLKLYALITAVATILLTIAVGFTMLIMIVSTQGEDCWNDDTVISDVGKGFGGDWHDLNSKTAQNMRHAADRFQKELHMSGDNIAAALAIGIRESGFNPEAYNPSGQVKGIWQWGAGSVNGNRYKDTPDTVEGQVQLAINELRSSHKETMILLATANNIESSLVAWDTKFEGVHENDPQRKVGETTKTAQEIKKLFALDFEGSIDVFTRNDGGVAEAANDANSSQLAQAACDIGLSTSTSGLPVQEPYSITGGYPNYDGLTGNQHYGVDFQTTHHDEGRDEANVYAVHDGIVVAKSYDSVGGNSLVIKGTDDVFTYYGHAPSQEAIVVNIGDKVKAGQHISRQGHTGAATGTHVHFAVQTKNQNGWAPMTVGLKSPGDYLKLPKKAGDHVVVPSGPFNASDSKDDK